MQRGEVAIAVVVVIVRKGEEAVMQRVTRYVNGVGRVSVLPVNQALVPALRQQLLPIDCKARCANPCGASAVIFDGKAVTVCLTPLQELSPTAKIAPIEGNNPPNNPHALQRKWSSCRFPNGAFGIGNLT